MNILICFPPNRIRWKLLVLMVEVGVIYHTKTKHITLILYWFKTIYFRLHINITQSELTHDIMKHVTSTWVNTYQQKSTWVNTYQQTSTWVNTYQQKSTCANTYQQKSTYVNAYQQKSTCVNTYQQKSTYINTYQQKSTYVNTYQHTSTCVNTYPQKSTGVLRLSKTITKTERQTIKYKCIILRSQKTII